MNYQKITSIKWNNWSGQEFKLNISNIIEIFNKCVYNFY